MQHRIESREKEIEQRINGIMSDADPDLSAEPKKRKISKLYILVASAFVLTAPLWIGRADYSESTIDPVYYKIKRVTIEYPVDMEPNITLKPAGSGCAYQPRTRRSNDLKSILRGLTMLGIGEAELGILTIIGLVLYLIRRIVADQHRHIKPARSSP